MSEVYSDVSASFLVVYFLPTKNRMLCTGQADSLREII